MLWTKDPWSVGVSYNGQRQTVKLQYPFALVGSDPGCEIQVRQSRFPRLAYFLCLTTGGLEAWPLTALAKAHWGRLPEGNDLTIGGVRLTVQLDRSRVGGGAQCPQTPVVDLPLQVRCRDWQQTSRLHHTVTIIGQDHPSVIRLADSGLQQCAGALVVDRQELWYVSFSDLQIPPQKRVREVTFDQPLRLGGYDFRPPARKSIDLNEPGIENDSNWYWNAPAAQEAPKNLLTFAQDAASERLGGSAMVARPEPAASRRRDVSPRDYSQEGTVSTAAHSPAADALTTDLTRRLASISGRRKLKQLLLQTGIVSVVTAAAIYVILKVWEASGRTLPTDSFGL